MGVQVWLTFPPPSETPMVLDKAASRGARAAETLPKPSWVVIQTLGSRLHSQCRDAACVLRAPP